MIVVSDMMGTLTTGSPVLGLVDWVRHNQSAAQANLYTASIMPSYFLVKLGLIDPQSWGQQLMIESLGLVRQATGAKFAEIAAWTVEKNLWPKRRQDVIDRLLSHASSGDQVYIASSVVAPVVEEFARRISAQAIGTPVEFQAGRVQISTGLVASDRKIQQVLSRLQVSRVDFAYGDTAMDVPLLENAAHPVAVYPDAKLKAISAARGWEILEAPGSKP